MRDGPAPVAFRRNDGLDAGIGDLLANGIGIIAFVGKECLDPVSDHSKQRREALDVVRLPRRQHKAERAAFGVASGMELGGEAAARSAKRVGRLSPLFMPTAQ